MKKHVELLAVLPDGNFVRMQILKAEIGGNIVRIYVTYEAMADVYKNHGQSWKLSRGEK